MTKTKVSELEGEKLAEWTARAQGWHIEKYFMDDPERSDWVRSDGIWSGYSVDRYRPDIDGGQAMELAKKFELIINFEIGEVWKNGESFRLGDDYSAICRAAIASEYGEYVEEE